MSRKKTSSLEKIGYIKALPKEADIDDYEMILIKDIKGKEIKLYRNITEKEKIDDTTNFSTSWKIFNSYL